MGEGGLETSEIELEDGGGGTKTLLKIYRMSGVSQPPPYPMAKFNSPVSGENLTFRGMQREWGKIINKVNN